MTELITVLLLYVIPTILVWRNCRKLAIVSGIRVDYRDVLATFFPVVNVINIFITYAEIIKLLPQERTPVERIFAIKQSDYWKKDGEVD